MINIKNHKTDVDDFNDFKNSIWETLKKFQQMIEQQRDQQLTLEHYTERYMPFQVQNMIVENLSALHDETEMAKISVEEDSLTAKVRDQLLDSTQPAKGTIFDNIIKINNQMTKLLGMRIDLRTPSAIDADSAPKVITNEEERQKYFEGKCEEYIEKFIKLNRENVFTLDKSKSDLKTIMDQQIVQLQEKVDNNIKKI